MGPLIVFFLLFALAQGQQRPYCQGKSCSIDADCAQPSGAGGNIPGYCCSNTCYAQENLPTIGLGGTCDNTLSCKQCAYGLTCANSAGQEQGGIVVGPFSCQNIVTSFTPDCKCNNSNQCTGGTCGGKQSKCLADGLFSDSQCDFSEQCISGYCNGGKCQGRTLEDRTSTCTSNNQCPLDHICSQWQSPPATMCHGLSKTGDVCYSDTDCAANRFQTEMKEECTGQGSGPGQCTPLPGKGQYCGTSTTPSNCAYYDVTSSYRTQYYCNTSLNPAVCTELTISMGDPVGTACLKQAYTCASGLYCQLNTNQIAFTGMGTCQQMYNIPKGSNCSDPTEACVGGANGQTDCRQDSTSGFTTCQDSMLGKTCNHTNTQIDADTQCANYYGNYVCGCNDVCVVADQGSGSVGCNERQQARWNGLFISGVSDATDATPAWANYKGDRRALADRACCTGCKTSAETDDARYYGVTIDCKSLSISIPKICDSSYKPVYLLQNCKDYVPNAASSLSISFLVVFLSSFITLMMSVHN